MSFNGVQITFVGQANQFDEFVFDPVKGGAGGLALALERPQDIAAASPLIISANPNNKSQVLVDAFSACRTGKHRQCFASHW